MIVIFTLKEEENVLSFQMIVMLSLALLCYEIGVLYSM